MALIKIRCIPNFLSIAQAERYNIQHFLIDQFDSIVFTYFAKHTRVAKFENLEVQEG